MIAKLFILPFPIKMYKACVLVLLILNLLLLCACNGNDIMQQYYKVENNTISVSDLTTVVYTEVEIDNIINSKYDIHSLNKEYPVECVRYRSQYSVCYIGNESYAIVYYEEDGTYSWSQKCKISALDLNDYLVLEKGRLLSTVKELDPNGDYFLTQGLTGRVDIPSVSKHYTQDGYVVEIFYDTIAVGENHPKIINISYYLL